MEVNNRAEVASNMKRLRKEQGITKEALARLTGYSVRHIDMLEHETVAVSINCQYRLCKTFGVSYKDLVC